MRQDIWNNNIVPIVLLPDGEAGERLLSIAERWVKAWMLNPALWIRVADAIDDEGNLATTTAGVPPRITATVLGRNKSAQVDLFRELGRNEVKIARLATVRALEPHISVDPKQDQIVDVIAKYVGSSSPLREVRDSGLEVGTLLKKINLIFAPTEREGADFLKLVEVGWDANVVVAPEDRPTPSSFDAFTRYADQERMDAFVLANIASAVGLWAGVNKSVFELTEHEYDKSSQGSRVVLQRSFVRGIASDGYVHRVAARALEAVSKVESPLDDPIIATFVSDLEVMETGEVLQAVNSSVSQVLALDNGRLAFHSPLHYTQLDKQEIGVWEQIKHFLRFTLDKLIGIPGLVLDTFTMRFEKKANALLHSDDGFAVVKTKRSMGRSRLDAKTIDDLTWLAQVKARLSAEMNAPFPLMRKDNYPSLLRGIRQLSFSLLDGSEPPEGLTRAGNIEGTHRLRVVGNTLDLFPDYNERWSPPDEIPGGRTLPGDSEVVELQWTEGEVARKWVAEMDTRISRYTGGQAKLQPRIDELRTAKNSFQAEVLALDELISELQFEIELEKSLEGSPRTEEDKEPNHA